MHYGGENEKLYHIKIHVTCVHLPHPVCNRQSMGQPSMSCLFSSVAYNECILYNTSEYINHSVE